MTEVKQLLKQIEEADAILVGAGSGFSTATGLNIWYEDSDLYNEGIRHYAKKYQFDGMFNGFYASEHFPEEEKWGYRLYALDMILNLEAPKPTYQYLKQLIQDKPFHIMTTNQDTIFYRYFKEENISEIQGSWHYYQSSHTETDKQLYPTQQWLEELLPKIENYQLAKEYIPTSTVDGAPLEAWVRGPRFLEDDRYHQEHQKINQFIGKYKDKKILFLELGVGRMTPMFIQEPFWEMTQYLPHAFYININPNDALTHPQIQEQSLLIHNDIHRIIEEAVQLKEKQV